MSFHWLIPNIFQRSDSQRVRCSFFMLHLKIYRKTYISMSILKDAPPFFTARFIVAANPVNSDTVWFLQIIIAAALWRLGAKPGTAAGSWQANALHRFFCCLTPPAESKKLTASQNPHDRLLLTCWAPRADEACTKPAYHYWPKKKKSLIFCLIIAGSLNILVKARTPSRRGDDYSQAAATHFYRRRCLTETRGKAAL